MARHPVYHLDQTSSAGTCTGDVTYRTRANHDDWALGVRREAECRAPDVDGDLEDSALLVRAARTLNGVRRVVHRGESRLFAIVVDERRCVVVMRSVLDVEQEVRTDTVDPALLNIVDVFGLVLEYNDGRMNSVGVELGAGGDRVEPRLQTRDRRHDNVEGNLPCRGVRGGGNSVEVVTGGELQDFAELHASVGHDSVVALLVRVQVLQGGLGLRCRRILGQSTKDLTTGEGADVDVVTEDGSVSSGYREGNLGQCGIERLNVDDSVLLLVETESAEKAVDFCVSIQRPNTDVITVLVRDTGTLCAELNVHAVAVRAGGKEFLGHCDGCRVGVLCVMDALGAGESAGRELAWGDRSVWQRGRSIDADAPR